ncbi:hypothetical protein [Mycobacteroides salmoniphilum]|nr:hypothetical protein [Mycobacteroides salmoniphilum]
MSKADIASALAVGAAGCVASGDVIEAAALGLGSPDTAPSSPKVT